MRLKQQLLLVSLLTLILPWAGCQFVQETESALRASQQQMLGSTARAIADSISQYAEEFPIAESRDHQVGDRLYGHPLATAPLLDGYIQDWDTREWLQPEEGDGATVLIRTMSGADGDVQYAVGVREPFLYVFAQWNDKSETYLPAGQFDTPGMFSDRLTLVSANPPYLEEQFVFAPEAPGELIAYRPVPGERSQRITEIRAIWQDMPGGYRFEARIPMALLGTHLGIVISNSSATNSSGVRSSSFSARSPGAFAYSSRRLSDLAGELIQPGMRLTVTDAQGWRIASAGDPQIADPQATTPSTGWLRILYAAMLEPGNEAALAGPHPSGRESEAYIRRALEGGSDSAWFRSDVSGKAVVAAAEPVTAAAETIGAIVLQQGTDDILTLRNKNLTRLMYLTLIATLTVAIGLLGYATLLSRRVRRLSAATEKALDSNDAQLVLPSAESGDEIGDLSRSFSSVLGQIGEYNSYLQTLASKLSHELRTPLAIVTSSLDNLEHEDLGAEAKGYTSRAKDGANRLRQILSAMSEASRVEELMQSVELEAFDLAPVLESTTSAYGDAYVDRQVAFENNAEHSTIVGSPELLIQMLDKLVDNAASFSAEGDTIQITLDGESDSLVLGVYNPGPPLPASMRGQMFDSMVSIRDGGDNQHLGLGLYIAKLIVEGHGGRLVADNVDAGVRFDVQLKVSVH